MLGFERQDSTSVIPPKEEIEEFRERLLDWYSVYGRHFPWRNKSTNHYRHIIAEILLQRTQADTAAVFFRNFIKRFPSWKQLAQASEEDLQEIFKPIGLWRRRAASLYALAQEMNKRKGRFPKDRSEIERLPGIGQYIANAVQLFVNNERLPLLDSNMARVLERYFGPRKLADIRDDPYLQALATSVVDYSEPSVINWAILDFASKVCKLNNPLCPECPLREKCQFANQAWSS